MKKQIFRVVGTTILSKSVKVAAALFILVGSYSAQAQTSVSEPSIKNTVIKHLGRSGDMMTVQLKLDNEKGDRFSVVLKDRNGVVLYHDTYTDKKFDKRFKLQIPDNNGIVFFIRNLSDNSTESYEVNTTTKVVEEVSITKLGK